MQQLAPRSLTIQWDDREKNLLSFPEYLLYYGGGGSEQLVRLTLERCRLPVGDYAVKGRAHLSCLEAKKMGIQEVYANTCTPDQWRFRKALRALSDKTANPLILVTMSPRDITIPTGRCPCPTKAWDRFVRLCTSYGVSYFVAPTPCHKRDAVALGECMARWLIAASESSVVGPRVRLDATNILSPKGDAHGT